MQNNPGKPAPKTVALPGNVEARYVRCGAPTCHCARGELHGPYFRRHYWQNGRRRRQYVRLAELEVARAAVVAWRGERETRRAARRQSRLLAVLLREYSRLSDDVLHHLEGSADD
jgi:hypothetical protein